MTRLEEAARALVEQPARSPSPVAQIERRAATIGRRRRAARFTAVGLMVAVTLGVAVVEVSGKSSQHVVASGGSSSGTSSVPPSCPAGSRTYLVGSDAMAPALHLGQRVTVAPLTDASTLRRADIVAFQPPATRGLLPRPTVEIKRVVGLPGETIQAINGKVEINGRPLNEPYLAPGTVTTQLPAQQVPTGTYFVLGDRRSNSQDSRSYGAISASVVTGRLCAVTGP